MFYFLYASGMGIDWKASRLMYFKLAILDQIEWGIKSYTVSVWDVRRVVSSRINANLDISGSVTAAAVLQ